MTLPQSWKSIAFNPVPDSDNQIHSDAMARDYGFRGGLVPGVVVSAYLLHPAALAWGRAWLERGSAHVEVRSPVYDNEAFEVEVDDATDSFYRARLIDPDGKVCALATATLPGETPRPPAPRGLAPLDRNTPRPDATPATMLRLRDEGLRALPAHWSDTAEITHYLRRADAMAPLYRDEGFANPAFILGLSNWVMAQNVSMNPWVHLQTDSQHFDGIEWDTQLFVEAKIDSLFEKKGHAFFDADVAIFRQADHAAVAMIRLRAIYQLAKRS